MIPAALIGHALSICTTDIDNGIIEGGVMLVIFIATNIKVSHVIYRPFLVLFVGYGFAWVRINLCGFVAVVYIFVAKCLEIPTQNLLLSRADNISQYYHKCSFFYT